jgi:hypothetical protein
MAPSTVPTDVAAACSLRRGLTYAAAAAEAIERSEWAQAVAELEDVLRMVHRSLSLCGRQYAAEACADGR